MLPLLCVLTALLGAPLPPVKPLDQAKGPPPRVMVATVDKDGRASLLGTVIKMVPEKRTIQTLVDGKVVSREVTASVQVLETRRVALDATDVTLYDGTGKKITAGDLKKLLPETAPVLVSADGKEVDPFFLRVVRKGTVVVVCPALARVVEALPMMRRPEPLPPVKKVP